MRKIRKRISFDGGSETAQRRYVGKRQHQTRTRRRSIGTEALTVCITGASRNRPRNVAICQHCCCVLSFSHQGVLNNKRKRKIDTAKRGETQCPLFDSFPVPLFRTPAMRSRCDFPSLGPIPLPQATCHRALSLDRFAVTAPLSAMTRPATPTSSVDVECRPAPVRETAAESP